MSLDAVCMDQGQFNEYEDGKKAYVAGACDVIAWDSAMTIAGLLVGGGFTTYSMLNSEYEFNFANDDSNAAIFKKSKSEAVVIGENIFYITWP